MKVALVLFAYAALLAVAAPRLRRARWVDRAPRVAVSAWVALVSAMVTSVVLGGLSLAVPVGELSGDLAEVVRGCVTAARAQYAAPGGAIAGVTGSVLAVVVTGRLALCALLAVARTALGRRQHRRTLSVVGRRDERLDAVVVEHQEPAAYCVPGRHSTVVLTTAALRDLADDEIAAVLAHERAHLRGRHHLLTAAMATLVRAFAFVPVFATARREVERLVELLADDSATRSCSRLAVADALLTVGAAPTPVGAMGAGGSTTALRVRRLIAHDVPLTRAQRSLGSLAAAAVVAVPLLVATAPAVAAVVADHCPVVHGAVHHHHG